VSAGLYRARLSAEFHQRLATFRKWLEDSGAIIHPPTNTYEVLRYRCLPKEGASKRVNQVIYQKADGTITFTGFSEAHYSTFVSGGNMCSQEIPEPPVRLRKDGTPYKVRPKKAEAVPSLTFAQKMRPLLLERDGDDCWFCGKPLGLDITIEHLLPQKLKREQGVEVDHIENLVLAHAYCNRMAGHLPMTAKIAWREHLRNPPPSNVPHWDDPDYDYLHRVEVNPPARSRGS
jgi:hypothetical protein